MKKIKKTKKQKNRILNLKQIEKFCKNHKIQYVLLHDNYIWLTAYNFTYNIEDQKWTNYLGLKWYYVSDFSSLYFKYCRNNKPYKNRTSNKTTSNKNIHDQKTTPLKPIIDSIPPEAKMTSLSSPLHKLQQLQLIAREIAIAKGYKPVNSISPGIPPFKQKNPDK